MARKLIPRLVLLSLILGSELATSDMSSIEGIRIFKERYPRMQILMLTVYDDDDRIFDVTGSTTQRVWKTGLI